MAQKFLQIEPEYYDYNKARFVVVPVPYERTTSFVKGTKNAPTAILNASQQLETFDEELKSEPYKKAPVYTLSACRLNRVPSTVEKVIKDKKIPVILGGEHSITPGVVKTIARHYPDLSVLQFDAHADLRDCYQGKKVSHACVMRRVLEICPAVQVGIRSISAQEWEYASKTGQVDKIHWAQKVELVEKIENQLSRNVYITIDVDVFDPAALPAVGTPEPGGMFWYEILDILSRVCRDKNVVGIDLVELCPQKGSHASDFTVAKLAYKIMGYISSRGNSL